MVFLLMGNIALQGIFELLLEAGIQSVGVGMRVCDERGRGHAFQLDLN